MRKKPKKQKLKRCMELIANAMNMNPLPEDKANQLIDHILYDGHFNEIKGKGGWISFEKKLATPRELRNLFMAHCATKISKYNEKKEPNCDTYSTKKLCDEFENTLFGKTVIPWPEDVLDDWEK